MKLLHIDSSILGAHSVSRQLTKETVAKWVSAHPETTVEYLDLAVNTPAHLNSDSVGFAMPMPNPSDAQKRENSITQALVDQFKSADVVVVGAPLYNFSIPSQLKAWIDRIGQRGHTFAYTETGPKGLAGAKTIFVVSTRGGEYSTTEQGQALEHQESYLKAIFNFVGSSDVRFIRAEGVAMGDAKKAEALQTAANSIAKLAA